MNYYQEYILGLIGEKVPGWEKVKGGYRKGEHIVRIQKDKPAKGEWNAALFKGAKMKGCWYSCAELEGIELKARELAELVG